MNIKKLIFSFLLAFYSFLFGVSASQLTDNEEDESIYKKGINFRNNKDYQSAEECFLVLAKTGHIKACHNYAMCRYHLGDDREAYDWFLLAAKKGLTASANNIKKLNLLFALLPDECLINIMKFMDIKTLYKFQ